MAQLPVEEFLNQLQNDGKLLIDVRSENEYLHAHIPGAVNIPLLNNEHRILVGTCYKQKGREAAVRLGFELVGPLFHSFIAKVDELQKGRELLVYCWRGGMRSGIMSWLLSMSGYQVNTLKGGYKFFRRYVFESLAQPKRVVILGGHTGTGKTKFLKLLKDAGEQVVDLEGLANHRGSAFGQIGLPPQPMNEHFENLLALEWRNVLADRPVWIEAESRSIGRIKIPDVFYPMFMSAPVVELDVSIEKRIDNILADYGKFDKAELANCTRKIEKRLGNQRMKECLHLLEENRMEEWVELLLIYYDKQYAHSLAERKSLSRVKIVAGSADKDEHVVAQLIHAGQKIYKS